MKNHHKSTNNAITFPENLNQSLTSLLQNRQALCEETLNLVLVGVSCRNYAQAVEAVCGRGVSASSVSRRIKRAAADKVEGVYGEGLEQA